MPYVTGHRYRVHWGEGLDFTRMKVEVSERWEEDDNSVRFSMNFTDVREAINFTTDYGNGQQLLNETLTKNLAHDYLSGFNIVYNDTETREFDFVINGRTDPAFTGEKKILIEGFQCAQGECPLDEVPDVPVETTVRLWSKESSWEGQFSSNADGIPKEGDDVEVKPGWNMVYDLAESPILELLTINGRLTFQQEDADEGLEDKDLHLKAHHIFIRAGELIIGTAEKPFTKIAKITLYGEQDAETIVMDGAVEAGNKVIANMGLFQAHGAQRSQFSRLKRSVNEREKEALVETGLDWVAGDQLYFAPTTVNWKHSDYLEIESYDATSGIVKLKEEFDFYHYGAYTSTGERGAYNDLDMRGEVILLTRNIVIEGESSDDWGGHIVTLDRAELFGAEIVWRRGQLIFDSVEVAHCSQRDTYKSALRFENSNNVAVRQTVSNSVIHHSLAWGLYITSSSQVDVSWTYIVGARAVGVNLNSVTDTHLLGVGVFDVRKRDIAAF
jgi:hypothetical protein